MFGPFLDKLKQGGFSGMANGGNADVAKQQFHPQPSQGFVGPMLNQGLAFPPNPGPAGMNKAPGFGFMKTMQAKTVPQAPMTGPQRPRPNRGKLRSF